MPCLLLPAGQVPLSDTHLSCNRYAIVGQCHSLSIEPQSCGVSIIPSLSVRAHHLFDPLELCVVSFPGAEELLCCGFWRNLGSKPLEYFERHSAVDLLPFDGSSAVRAPSLAPRKRFGLNSSLGRLVLALRSVLLELPGPLTRVGSR